MRISHKDGGEPKNYFFSSLFFAYLSFIRIFAEY